LPCQPQLLLLLVVASMLLLLLPPLLQQGVGQGPWGWSHPPAGLSHHHHWLQL
jgi:hypothetical protein